MCPVQVIHICDICGAKGLRQDVQMGRLLVSHDSNTLMEVSLACSGCKMAIQKAVETAWHERKGINDAGKDQGHSS